MTRDLLVAMASGESLEELGNILSGIAAGWMRQGVEGKKGGCYGQVSEEWLMRLVYICRGVLEGLPSSP